MKIKDNYPKAIAIYEAVLQWIQEEHTIPSLTVSEIAKRAGVGKGTVYDYFVSKEQIVAKSYIYGYKKIIDYLMEKISECETLREKLECIYEVVADYGCLNNVFEIALKIVRNPEEMKKYVSESFEKEQYHLSYYETIIDDLILSARKEMTISDTLDHIFIQFVFFSAIQTIFSENGLYMIQNNLLSKEQYFDYMYHMICASLTTKR